MINLIFAGPSIFTFLQYFVPEKSLAPLPHPQPKQPRCPKRSTRPERQRCQRFNRGFLGKLQKGDVALTEIQLKMLGDGFWKKKVSRFWPPLMWKEGCGTCSVAWKVMCCWFGSALLVNYLKKRFFIWPRGMACS